MAKIKGSGTKEDPAVITMNGSEPVDQNREFVVKSCIIKDEKPVYSLERMKPPQKGLIGTEKGPNPVHEDMIEIVKKLNVHLACIDDAFLRTAIKVTNITQKMTNNPLVALYTVTGFKITGKEEDEKVSLIGKKYLEVGGYAAFTTPEVLLSKFSSYKPWKDLKEVIDEWREEVELYHSEGKCMPVEEEDTTKDLNQGKLDLVESAEDMDGEFESARV